MATSFDSFNEDPVIITSASTHPFDDDDEDYFRVESEGPVGFGSESNGEPILPPLSDMQPEEGIPRREWRRQNMMLLEEKEKTEKERREQIVLEAVEYKNSFYEKKKLNVETNKSQNHEKEKLFLSNKEKFHANAEKQYWKAVSDLIPHEIVNLEKRKSKKDQENKKPSVNVIQGPKPGKPTDMARMRQILVKLKHNAPVHMKPVEEKGNGLETGKGKQPVGSTSVPVSVK